MGGPGSGNFHWEEERKSTVEESLVVSMRDFRERLYRSSSGSLTWTWRDGGKSSVGYTLAWNNGNPVITLEYRWRGTEDVRTSVWLEMTPTRFGGSRWWFSCPMVTREIACNRRSAKLYLPPGAKFFGCRVCHDLTYRSSQEAHQGERALGRLGLDAESASFLASQWDEES